MTVAASNAGTPLVSVVMPVFNGGRYLLNAVASIVEQSFKDWELICVDDGSSDGSGELLDWLASQDSRIQVIHQQNAGIVSALNTGCCWARAPLICRMDCDDIAMPHRLANQVAFLENHPECVVVGGAILEIDADGDPLRVSRLPEQHDAIVENLLNRRTGHYHPATLFRAEAFKAVGGYRAKFQWVEDHDLWLRLSRRGKLCNLNETVLCYRQHASSVCWQRSAQQRELMNELLSDAYRVRGLVAPEKVLIEETVDRSPAGPGKWARAAAKGGFAKVACKHLATLNRQNLNWFYRFRMSLEVTARLIGGMVRRLSEFESICLVPAFPEWIERERERRQSSRHNKAA